MLATLVVMLGLVAQVSPASAAQDQPTIAMLNQVAYVNADGEFTLSFAWDGGLSPDIEVVFRVYQPLTSAAQLGMAPTPGNVLTVPWEQPLISLERPANGQFTLTVPVRSFSTADSTALYLPGSGVHPVSLELTRGGTTIGRITTNLIHLPGDATSIEPVPVSIVLPVTHADGLATGVTVADATTILTHHPDLPLTVQIGASVLSQLEIDSQLNEDFRTALADRTVIVSPGLDLDPSALAAINQGALFTQSVESARNQARELGLRPATNVFPWDGTITSEGVDLLTSLGVDIVLTAAGSTIRSGQLVGTNTTLNVIQPNNEFSTELDIGADAVTRAYELLAELALLTETDRSPVVLGGNGFQRLDRKSLGLLLEAWEGLGPVQPVSLEEAVRQMPDRANRAAESPEQDLAPLREVINQIDAVIQSYTSYYISGGAEPNRFRTALISALSRERNPADRLLRIEQLATNVEAAFAPITIVDQQEFTLTTTRFALPLQLRNDAEGPRLVHLRFQSDKIKVYTDDTYTTNAATSDVVVTLEPGETTITINVEAQTLGRSPVDVIVLTPDGQRQLASGSFAIRSTAIPGLGLLLSGTAGVFLVLWWFLHHRRERQAAAIAKTQSDSVTA
ncbi:MAG: hypothetical protein R2706_06770 [Acidimicrobiales bacterium]